jgi:protein-S-isoprenylcysteine O-methyltransferase Ste14
MGIIIFSSPFIDQPRIAEIMLARTIGVIIAFIGLGLCILALREFRKFGLSIKLLIRKELRRPDVRPETVVPHKLVTSGLYSAVRHPQMLGFIIFYTGYSLCFGAVYSLYWLPLIIFIIYVAASIEERDLEKEFGQEYKEYKKKVSMFLL